MKRLTCVAALLGAFLMACAVPAAANDSSVGSEGGSVVALQSSSVRLEAETVQAIVYNGYAEFRVDFRFVNDGPRQTVTLGFPFVRGSYEDQSEFEAGFRAWKGSTPLPVKTVEGMDGSTHVLYYTHQAVFEPGVTRITVQYLTNPSATYVNLPSIGEQAPWSWASTATAYRDWYDYTLHTGANWKGTIGRSLVRVTFADDVLGWRFRGLTHDAMTQGDRVIVWDFRDYEPRRAVSTNDRGDDIRFEYLLPADFGLDEAAQHRRREVEATASSNLDLGGNGLYDYKASNAVDTAPFTAWAEAAPGTGRGEWVKVSFAGGRSVREIRVLPGYAKRPDLFHKYNRPKTLDVAFSDGTRTTLHLADEPSLQRFAVKADAKWAKATIGDVYRGTTRNDTYISELDFAEAPAPTFATFQKLTGLKDPVAQPLAAEGSQTATASASSAVPSTPAAPGGAGSTRTGALTPARWLGFLAAAAGILGLLALAIALVVRRSRHLAAGPAESLPPGGPPAPVA